MKNIITTLAFGAFLLLQPAFAIAEPLGVEDKFIDFTLPDHNNRLVTLSEELKKGPVVLSFYRGGWCPICNRQLFSYQQILPKIQEAGAQLIAVSPETPGHAEKTITANNIDFTVLSDVGNVTARDYGILWQVPEDSRENFSKWLQETTGESLSDFNAQEGYGLPMPATFVITKNGTIAYAFVDPDYKKRADNNEILQILQTLEQ